ncbi:hypothetical protein HDU82_000637 [Entophlyctis luteolus]|nr:hypothetical protein HDU82_000637 [Entophlyctis luteolus]
MDSSAPLFHNPPSRPVPSNLQPAQPLLPASSQPAQQHQQRNSISHPINVSWLFPRNVLAPSPDTPSPLLTHPDGITPVDLLDLLGVSCKNYPTGRAPSSSGFIGGFPVAKIARQNATPKEQLDSTDVPLHENTKKPPETNENSAIAPEQPSAAYPPKETAALIGNGADASTHGREEIELAEAISGDDRAASSGFDDGTPEENSSSGNDNRALSQRNRFIRLPNGVEIRGDSDEATYGNLGLSSCPGKKVRLDTGPVGGRAVINRDLGTDFARLKSVGVVCVVW